MKAQRQNHKLYSGQLIKTYEGGALTSDVKDKIEEIKKI
jgi:hypothetical protein